MKRRATAILLGIMVSSMFLSACGKNEAKEAANESAQVEEEGVGEVTEEGEKVEAENKNASDADDSSKAGDSAKSDEDNKETSVKEEEDGDSSGKDSDDESEEDAEVTEASAGKIGVLLSDDDEDAKIDSEEMTSQIEDGGYEADVKNAGGDPALQISQIQEFIDEQVSALIIDPVDSYGLTDILKTANEQEIPVISYDSLIRDTADINYYATYDTRSIGNDIAKEIIPKTHAALVSTVEKSNSSLYFCEIFIFSNCSSFNFFIFSHFTFMIFDPYPIFHYFSLTDIFQI